MTSLYAPYKAVGFVTDGNPFIISNLGTETFLISSINRSFQVYRIDKLTVCMASTLTPGTIDHLYAIGHETFVAVGPRILVYNRGKHVRTYDLITANEGASMDVASDVRVVCVCGVGAYLLTADNKNNITIINTKERVIVSKSPMLSSSSITSFIHPATYINKFLIGYGNGQLDLWNSNKQTIIYSFKSHIEYFRSLAEASSSSFLATTVSSSFTKSTIPAITAMEQSPACDVIGLGFESGDILLMNIKLDKVLFSFKQDNGGAVTSLAFRTDAEAAKFPYLASSSADGRIFIWNLGTKRAAVNSSSSDPYNVNRDSTDSEAEEAEDDSESKHYFERKLQFVMEDAHMLRINQLHFLHGEPILISNSLDNSIKMWIFDTPDGKARLLRSRSGHSANPTKIRYYGGITNASAADNADARSCEIVSIGSDATVRLFNTALENQNMEMSQSVALRKQRLTRRNQRLPQCIGFDVSEARERTWGNMVTIHKNHCNSYVWRYKHRTITEMILKQPQWSSNELTARDVDTRNHHSTAVCLSSCGNYCAIGCRAGVIYLYNIQSGLTRGSFPADQAASLLSAKVVKIRENVAGNVLQLARQVANEGKGGETNSLKRKDPPASAPNDSVDTTIAIQTVRGHSLEVTGLFIDMANTIMCSCSLDGYVIFWNFLNHEIISAAHFETPHLRLVGSRDTGFIAVIGQDRTVRLFDLSIQRLIRRFTQGHSREVSDIAFTPDGRRLVSSSVDSTVRVWDIPTGRCLSWMSFEAPVLSVTISHSGEYLCLVQAGKLGIFMCIDKSLYETVHFWKEPTVPVFVADSTIVVDRSASQTDGTTAMELDALAQTGDDSKEDIVPGDHLVSVASSQAQVEDSSIQLPEIRQHGIGTITMTTVPRAYWTSLFNLELIKERNKPIAPPEAPKAAPFFLPTVFRGGSTSSFPTPEEAKRLMSNVDSFLQSSNPASASISSTTIASSSKIETEEEKAMREMAAMSAWGDDDDTAWGESSDAMALTSTEKASQPKVESAVTTAAALSSGSGISRSGSRSNSRILTKRVAVARSNLAVYLAKLRGLHEETVSNSSNSSDILLEYLKTLSAPAIDLEFRSLCTHLDDEEGLLLLHDLLEWFASVIVSGTDFELIQAYITRALKIYAETILKCPQRFSSVLQVILANHQSVHAQFRDLMQSNLCLLKLLSGLPST